MRSTRTVHRVIQIGHFRYHVYLSKDTLDIRRMYGRHHHPLILKELVRLALGELPLEAEQLPLPFDPPAKAETPPVFPEGSTGGVNPYAPSNNPLFPGGRYRGD